MSTALETWAAGQDQSQGAAPEAVNEDELTGGGPDADHDHDLDHEEGGEGAAMSPEDARLAEKRAKDARIMKITGGVVGAILLAVAGFVGYAKFVAQEPAMQQPVAAQQPQADRSAVAAAAATASGATDAGQAGPVVAPVGVAQPGAPLDLGFQQPGGAGPVAGVPGGQQAVQGAPVAPAAPPATVPAQPPTVAAGGGAAPAPARAAAPGGQPVSSSAGDVERLQRELADMRAEHDKVVAGLREEIASLSKGGRRRTSRAEAPVRTAAASPSPERPFNGITERAERVEPAQPRGRGARPTTVVEHYEPVASPVMTEPRNVPVAPPAANKGGKVRGDFSIYAISNGRAWVHWNTDNENHMVGPNSVLPDGSRVTQLDDTKGVVFTTSGEIHPRPLK